MKNLRRKAGIIAVIICSLVVLGARKSWNVEKEASSKETMTVLTRKCVGASSYRIYALKYTFLLGVLSLEQDSSLLKDLDIKHRVPLEILFFLSY